MKMFVPLVLVCVMLAAGARTAAGQVLSSPHSHAGVAFNVAPPLGYGVDIAVPVSEKVNVRGGFNAFGISHDFDNDGITLAAQLKLRSVSAHLDWFPFGGGFHLSPGVMLYNGNEVNATALVPAGSTFDLGDENPAQQSCQPGDWHVCPVIQEGRAESEAWLGQHCSPQHQAMEHSL